MIGAAPPAWTAARRVLATPWSGIVLLGAALVAVAAVAPRTALFLAPAMALAGFLVWRQGLLRGAWYLFVLLLPLRRPLGVDVRGTTTLYAGDVLLVLLVLGVAWERGLGRVWARSPFLRWGAVLFALGAIGLPFGESLLLGVVALHQALLELAAFWVARQLVRNGADATRTLLAFLIGLAPAVAFGLWESGIRVELWNAPQWHGMDLEFDSLGHGHVRVQSTYDHTLRFSHPLSVGFGIALGLLSSRLRASRKLIALGIGVAAAWCNRFTYSVSGALATGAALVATWWVHRTKRGALVLPLALVVAIAAAPDTLTGRAARVLQGDSTSALARVVTYQQALSILRDHPLAGVGWGGAQAAFENRYRMSRASNVGFRAENFFLHRAVALGLPGLAVALVLCLRHLRLLAAIRRRPDLEAWPRDALLIGGVAFWVQAMLYPVDEPGTNQLLWILFALVESAAGPPLDDGGTA